MFAIVEIAGTQVKVSQKDKVLVPKLTSEVGAKVKFENVLLHNDGKKTTIGTPFIKSSYVEGKVLRHVKDDKVMVFKKKRRKGYRLKKGHRQQYTELEIIKVV